MRRAFLVSCVATAALAACGSTGDSASHLLHATPAHYLLTLDQLATPDFTVVQAAHSVDLATLTGGDATLQRQVQGDGFTAAASIQFFRQVDLATSNGPIEIIATVESFQDADGAHRSYARDAQRRDATRGEVPTSTGALGDEAHADSVVMTAPGGIPVVQITVEWRVANLIDTIIVRGRYGGARLDDALLLAHRMTANANAAS